MYSTNSNRLFRKRYVQVHEYQGNDYFFAANLLKKEGCKALIKYMRDTFSHHTEGEPLIVLPPTMIPKKCIYEGHKYAIVHTEFKIILIFEEQPHRTVDLLPVV